MTNDVSVKLGQLDELNKLVGLFKVHFGGLTLLDAPASEAMKALSSADPRSKKLRGGKWVTVPYDLLPRQFKPISIERGVRKALKDEGVELSIMSYSDGWTALTPQAYARWEMRRDDYKARLAQGIDMLVNGFTAVVGDTLPDGSSADRGYRVPSLDEYANTLVEQWVGWADVIWRKLWSGVVEETIFCDGLEYGPNDYTKFKTDLKKYIVSRIPTEQELRSMFYVTESAVSVEIASGYYKRILNKVDGVYASEIDRRMREQISALVEQELSELPDVFQQATDQIKARTIEAARAGITAYNNALTRGRGLPGGTQSMLRNMVAWYNAIKLGEIPVLDTQVDALAKALEQYDARTPETQSAIMGKVAGILADITGEPIEVVDTTTETTTTGETKEKGKLVRRKPKTRKL